MTTSSLGSYDSSHSVDSNWLKETRWLVISGGVVAVTTGLIRLQIDKRPVFGPWYLVVAGAALVAVILAELSFRAFGVRQVRLTESGVDFRYARRERFLSWDDMDVAEPPYPAGVGFYSRSEGKSAEVHGVTKIQAIAILGSPKLGGSASTRKAAKALGMVQ